MVRAFQFLVLLLLTSSACAQWIFGECDAAERAAYEEAVRDAVIANWKVPYDDRHITCTVLLSLNWRGEVLNVGIAKCGTDARIHRSVVDAGYGASPLPMPDDRACRERSVIVMIEFRPLGFDGDGESVDSE